MLGANRAQSFSLHRAASGIEPGTSRTLNENHTIGPSSQVSEGGFPHRHTIWQKRKLDPTVKKMGRGEVSVAAQAYNCTVASSICSGLGDAADNPNQHSGQIRSLAFPGPKIALARFVHLAVEANLGFGYFFKLGRFAVVNELADKPYLGPSGSHLQVLS